MSQNFQMILSVSFNFLYFPLISHAFPVSTVHPTQTRKTRFTYRAAFLSFDKTQPLQKNSHNTNPQKKHTTDPPSKQDFKPSKQNHAQYSLP